MKTVDIPPRWRHRTMTVGNSKACVRSDWQDAWEVNKKRKVFVTDISLQRGEDRYCFTHSLNICQVQWKYSCLCTQCAKFHHYLLLLSLFTIYWNLTQRDHFLLCRCTNPWTAFLLKHPAIWDMFIVPMLLSGQLAWVHLNQHPWKKALQEQAAVPDQISLLQMEVAQLTTPSQSYGIVYERDRSEANVWLPPSRGLFPDCGGFTAVSPPLLRKTEGRRNASSH